MMKNKLIRLITTLAGIAALFFTTGCETTEGFGRDVQEAGDAIEDTSQDVQR